MTWTNAFDIGPCEILLVHWVEGNPVVIPPSEWAANGVSITNNAGILTVDADLSSGKGFDVYVQPSYPTQSKKVRITKLSANFAGTPGSPYFYAYRDRGLLGEDPNGTIDLTTTNPVTPDPAEYPEYDWAVAGTGFGTNIV